jgi:RHS repeat-associated protein
LKKLENYLNVGRVTNPTTSPMTRAYGPWMASSHEYAVNHLGQRTLYKQDLKRYGNWNSTLYDRRVDRTYGYNGRGELASATSTYPNGVVPDAFLFQPVSETESYTYDAIGNRKTATIPKRAVVPTNQANLAGEFGFGVLPSGTGESVTYGEASNANTYTTVTKTNTNNPSNTGGTLTVTHKHDADGNLTDDGEFLYKYDAENRLIAVDIKVYQSGYGEAGFRYAYDHLHRRIRRQVVWWCGVPKTATADMPTQEISHFVYRGWNLALHIHQDYMCYNDTVGTVVGLDMGNYANGLSSRRTDRYVWGRDVSGSLQGAGGVGGLLMCVANPKHSVLWVADAMLPSMAYYFLYDGNGNVSETIHERGAVLGQYRYDGFGKLMGQNPTHYVITVNGIDQIVSGINQPFKFSTKWHDDTNHNSASYGPYQRSRSLVYYGYRTFSPDMGRWLGRDPIEEQGGLNLFVMVGNDSVNWLDLKGLVPVKEELKDPREIEPNFDSNKFAKYKKPTTPAYTVFDGAVDCHCCPIKGKDVWVIECRVRAWSQIYINRNAPSDLDEAVKKAMVGVSIQEVYGHEQQHAADWNEQVSKLITAPLRAERVLEFSGRSGDDGCFFEAKRLAKKYTELMIGKADAKGVIKGGLRDEVYANMHDQDTSTTRPADAEPHDPLPGSPKIKVDWIPRK